MNYSSILPILCRHVFVVRGTLWQLVTRFRMVHDGARYSDIPVPEYARLLDKLSYIRSPQQQ